jgi:hypothetical protein
MDELDTLGIGVVIVLFVVLFIFDRVRQRSVRAER